MPYPGNKLFDNCIERKIIPDKVEFYHDIDKGMFNMSLMSDNTWASWINYITIAERSWMCIKSTTATLVEKEDVKDVVTVARKASRYRIEADCPYCT
jgi:hypothetical protein